MTERFEEQLKSYRDNAPQAFVPPPAKALARRAIHRVRNRAAVAAFTGVSAVAVGVVSLMGVQGGPLLAADPSASPTGRLTARPSSVDALPSPANRVLPRTALLQASDVGPGYTATEELGYEVRVSWGMGHNLDGCPRDLPPGAPTVIDGVATFAPRPDPVEKVTGEAGVRFDRPGDRVAQHLRYSDAADSVINDYDTARLWAGQCPGFTFEGRHISVAILEESFAGDTSMLVRLVIEDGFSSSTRYHAFVRKGHAYTELAAADSPAAAKALAQKALERMCAAGLC